MKKKHTKLRLLMIVLLIAIGGVIYYFFMQPDAETKHQQAILNQVKVTQLSYNAEYGETYTIDQLIGIVEHEEAEIVVMLNGEMIQSDTELKFMELGDETLGVTVSYVGLDNDTNPEIIKVDPKVYEFELEIVDTQFPYFVSENEQRVGGLNYATNVGNVTDLNKYLSAYDPIDGQLEITYTGTVDYQTVGEYIVSAKAVDLNGNETTIEVSVTIKAQEVAQEPQRPDPYFIDASTMLGLVNAARSEAGESVLSWSSELEGYAKVRAQELCVAYNGDHTRPDGSSFSTVFTGDTVWWMKGENIAAGYRTIESVFEGWMNSQGHKENILRTEFDSIAIVGFNCGNQDTQGYEYYWVQLFGQLNKD